METANPSVEELMALDALVNGDIGAAQDEVVRRLSALLPGLIEAKNLERGWVGAMAIPLPSSIGLAPLVLTDENINQVLVGIAEESSAQGIGGAFRSVWNLTVTSVDARLETEQQLRVHWKRAEAIKTCLFAFLSGCVNGDGVQVWRMAEPVKLGLLSGTWAQEYSGTEVVFRLTQPPR